MKSITLHRLDDDLETRLSEVAAKRGLSLNQLIKNLLRERLGLDQPPTNHREDFEEFCGQWSDAEAKAFEKAVSDFATIDEEIWQ